MARILTSTMALAATVAVLLVLGVSSAVGAPQGCPRNYAGTPVETDASYGPIDVNGDGAAPFYKQLKAAGITGVKQFLLTSRIQAQGGFVEFTLAEQGLYPFLTHKLSSGSKGALGYFQAGELRDPNASHAGH